MGTVWELVSTISTPFLQSPIIIFVLALIVIGADAGVFVGLGGTGTADISQIDFTNVLGRGASGLTYEQAINEPSLVVIHGLAGYCVKPLLIDTSGIIDNTGVANSIYPCQYISNPVGEATGSNIFGQLLTGFFNLFGLGIEITSFMLFTLMILATVGFWSLTALTGGN